MRTQTRVLAVLACLCVLGAVQAKPAIPTDIFSYIRSLTTKVLAVPQEIRAVPTPQHLEASSPFSEGAQLSHLENELNGYDVADFNKYCKFKSLADQLGCFVSRVGTGLTPQRIGKFNSIAASEFSALFVNQDYIYKYLPEDKLDSYLPQYLKVFHGSQTQSVSSLADELRTCSKGFVFKWFPTAAVDKNDDQVFYLHARFFAADCTDQIQIQVIAFEGSRKGFYQQGQGTEANQAFVKSFCKDSLLFIINKHFGSI